jgi:hypothetical protein
LRVAQHVQRRDQPPMAMDELGQETNDDAEKKARSSDGALTRRGTHFAAGSEFQATEKALCDLIVILRLYKRGRSAGRW